MGGSGSVQRGESEQVGVGLFRRHPPLEHHAACAGHGQLIAVRRGLRGVARHPAVQAVVVDESLKVGQQRHASPELAAVRMEHDAQDVIDAETGMPESGVRVVHFPFGTRGSFQ